MITQNKRITRIVVAVAVLLLVPLLGTLLTDEVSWDIFDFIVAGGLLLGTGLLCELVWRKVQNPNTRMALCGIILVALIIVWVELAVGIFGTPFAGN